VKRCFDESNKDYLYRMLFFEFFVTHPYQDGSTFVSFDHLEHRRTGMFGCILTNVASIAMFGVAGSKKHRLQSMSSSGRTWTRVVVL
jgi:hypothetical protein